MENQPSLLQPGAFANAKGWIPPPPSGIGKKSPDRSCSQLLTKLKAQNAESLVKSRAVPPEKESHHNMFVLNAGNPTKSIQKKTGWK